MSDEILAALARIEARLEDVPTRLDVFAAAIMAQRFWIDEADDQEENSHELAESLLRAWGELLDCAAYNRELREQEEADERAEQEAWLAKLAAKQAAGIASRAAKRAAKKAAVAT